MFFWLEVVVEFASFCVHKACQSLSHVFEALQSLIMESDTQRQLAIDELLKACPDIDEAFIIKALDAIEDTSPNNVSMAKNWIFQHKDDIEAIQALKQDIIKKMKNDDEEKKQNIMMTSKKVDLQEILQKLDQEIQDLYKYKAKYKVNDNGSITFYPTPNCEPPSNQNKSSFMNTIFGNEKKSGKNPAIQPILQQLNCKQALTYSDPDAQIIKNPKPANICSFINASITAWSEHYPFRFRVEHIWLLILQAVAIHVDQNAEKLRSKYVEHEEKMELKIDISGNPSHEEWQSVVEGFAEQIDKNTVDDTVKLFECNFSSSTMTERLSTKVTIMDICKNYFSYKCHTHCGFPEITLDGKKEDWIRLKEKAEKLLKSKVDKKFGAQWGEALLPLLNRFIVAFDGEIDCVFWNSMIKRGARGGSGGYSWFSGWFNILFPFIQSRANRFCVPYSMDHAYVEQGLNATRQKNGEIDQSDYPLGIASAPVIWDRVGKEIKLKFIAGFMGYKQDPKTQEICPNVGWCIAEALSDEAIKQRQEKKKRRW